MRHGARLDTLRNRLVLLIFAITAAAVGFIYLYVVPQLESSLTAEKLRRLERVSEEQAPQLRRAFDSDDGDAQVRARVRRIAQLTESRVTLLAIPPDEDSPFVVADSQGEGTAIQGDYGIAETAAEEGGMSSAVETIAGERVGATATTVGANDQVEGVAVLSSPLDDVADNVDLIRRQIVIAGAIALAVAALVGYWASGAVSRRLRRLRRAAEQVAGGDFTQQIPIDSQDELGQLARTFNEMQRRLARLDRTRKEFIANASHELRTPIFSLGGFVELLETEDPSAEEAREFMEEIKAQIERLQKLTAGLLDLSRLDADVMELTPRAFDLKQVAREVASEFRPMARAHRSRLEVRGRGQAVARADPVRVSQILRILIDNALTHTPEGTKVTVTAVRGADAAELIVGDDGKGIDKRALDRVFDRFYTGNTATGSGLGLAIAQELAGRMGGTLEAVSQRGYTAFTLRLPLERRAKPRRQPAEAAA